MNRCAWSVYLIQLDWPCQSQKSPNAQRSKTESPHHAPRHARKRSMFSKLISSSVSIQSIGSRSRIRRWSNREAEDAVKRRSRLLSSNKRIYRVCRRCVSGNRCSALKKRLSLLGNQLCHSATFSGRMSTTLVLCVVLWMHWKYSFDDRSRPRTSWLVRRICSRRALGKQQG